MKRVIATYRLKPAQQFKIKLKEPGIVHAIVMGYEERKVIHGREDALPLNEFPAMRVEIDPDGEERERTFALCLNHEIIQAPEMKYIGSAEARLEPMLFHLWEIFTPIGTVKEVEEG